MKTYNVISTAGANLRDAPSTTLGNIVKRLPHGAVVSVCEDFTAVNTAGGTTQYLAVLRDGRWLWCVDKLISPALSPLEKAAAAVVEVYNTIYDIGCRHAGGAKSLDDIKRLKLTTCSSSASAVLQAAGCLPVGKTVSHTAAVSTDILKKKDTLEKAVKGTQNLIEGTCSVVRVGKKYADLPSAYKKAGIVYVQDSNICVSGGSGVIYSCNNTGGWYGKGQTAVKRTSGYPFTSPILYVIVPNP